jgi:DNA polymerase-3 subunit delta
MQTISLEFLDREFDKLALFTQDRRITRELLEKVFAGLPEVSVFALLDAISERKAKKALQLLRRQLNDGTYFTVILALLTRHVRQLWQAQVLQQQGIRGKALAKPLELNPFIAEKLGRAAMQFPAAVLKRNMLELIDADYFLKTGQAGDEVLEHIVIDLCRGEA